MLSIWRANPTQLFMTWVMYSNHQSVNMTWNTAKDKMKSNALEQFVDWIVAMIIMWMCWEFFWEIIECFDLRDDHNAVNCLLLRSSPTALLLHYVSQARCTDTFWNYICTCNSPLNVGDGHNDGSSYNFSWRILEIIIILEDKSN